MTETPTLLTAWKAAQASVEADSPSASGRQALELERDHLKSLMSALAHLKPTSRRQG